MLAARADADRPRRPASHALSRLLPTMNARSTQLDPLAIVLVVMCCASWGLQQVAIKVANAGISPVLQAGLRSAGAALLVWAWSGARGIKLFERDGSLWLGIAIAALFGSEFAFIYVSLEFTTAARGAIFLYTAPFFVALGAHFLIPGERLHGAKAGGLLAAFAGVGIAFSDSLGLPSHRELIGDAMMVFAGFLWAATTVVIKATRLVRLSPLKTLIYQLAGSALLLLPLSPLLGERGIIEPSTSVLLLLAYQVVVVAFASYIAWFWLIAHYPAAALSSFTFLTPIFGMLGGGLLLGEPITPRLAIAIALVGSGIYFVSRAQHLPGRKRAP